MKFHNQNQRKVSLMSGILSFSAYGENESCSLTLICKADSNGQTTAITNDEFAIVKVADVITDSLENLYNIHYVTLEKYKNDIPDWEDIFSSQMRDTAKRLSQKVQSEDYLAIKTTDSNGHAVFSSLPQGVYLVIRTKTSDTAYIFEPFLVAVPEPMEETVIENVVSIPKFERQKTNIPTQPPTTPITPTVPDTPTTPTTPTVPDNPITPPTVTTVITSNNGDGYLPQTGQMILPIYLLFALGVIFVTAGISLYAAGKNDEEE